MSSRFLISLKKGPLAVQKALSILNEASLDGETRIIDFQLGPPSHGKLPRRLFIDGRRALQCEFSDSDPSFLHDLREWMERCLVRDQEGTLHPELLTLNTVGTVLRFVMIHIGWDEEATNAKGSSQWHFDRLADKKEIRFLDVLYEDKRIINAWYSFSIPQPRSKWGKLKNWIGRKFLGRDEYSLKGKVYV